ncbi:MAG: GHMP kinase [Lachnospiraceae bacterium]|nr:GHMP kinase [Lachnospiraceae bacterium]
MSAEIKLFVPGRLCLFGEHSDWAGLQRTMNADIVPGRAIVTGIEQGIYGTAKKSTEFCVHSSLEIFEKEYFSCPMELSKLRQTAKQGGFFSYVAGVASYLSEWYHVGGVDLEITDMTLPIKSGLSSSAAICVMVARAFNELYGLQLNTLGIMNIAYLGEQRTPSRCGRLDQACAFGVNPVCMTFDGNEIEVDRIRVKKELHYVFADLMAGKDTVKILGDLNKSYPFPQTEADHKLHEALGTDNEALIARAAAYIAEGDTEKLGALMCEAQALFDEKVAPLCPQELTSPVLHETLRDEYIRTLTYGGKGVGSQGDGTVQFLAKDADTQRELVRYLEQDKGMHAYPLTLKPKSAVRKAIIPVAGFGTRLYPETRGIKKEFCPVVDRDGLVKPAILVLLEELDAIEMEEICLVINSEERPIYEDYFFKPLSEEHYRKLPKQMQAYEDKIRRIAGKLTFQVQKEQLGFGHAVYQCKEYAAGEPVMLLLGDTIYQSNTGVPCTGQLLEAYRRYGLPMVALHKVPLAQVVHYGIFAGTWDDKEQTIMQLTRIAEKPRCEYAKDFLSVADRSAPDNYYAAFGAYILTHEVFERLEEMVSGHASGDGEIQLTDALADVRKKQGMMGFVPDGESFDIGNAEAYRDTVSRFGLK